MNDPVQFRIADPVGQRDTIFALTREYFEWMNEEIERASGFTVQSLVGMSLEDYVRVTMQAMCSVDSREGIFYLVTLGGSETVAMGGLRRLPDGAAEIVRIYTRPAFRGRGFGRDMMGHLIAQAIRLGYETVRLDTAKFMCSAHRIYESLGFRYCAPYAGAEPPGQLHPIWLYMEKELAPDDRV